MMSSGVHELARRWRPIFRLEPSDEGAESARRYCRGKARRAQIVGCRAELRAPGSPDAVHNDKCCVHDWLWWTTRITSDGTGDPLERPGEDEEPDRLDVGCFGRWREHGHCAAF